MELINISFLMRKVEDKDDPEIANTIFHETTFDATKIIDVFILYHFIT